MKRREKSTLVTCTWFVFGNGLFFSSMLLLCFLFSFDSIHTHTHTHEPPRLTLPHRRKLHVNVRALSAKQSAPTLLSSEGCSMGADVYIVAQ